MENINTKTHNGITSIEFYHPQSNSFTWKMLEKLAFEIHFAGNNPETKVIIIRSIGDIFCAGASIDELLQIKTTADGLKFFSGFEMIVNTMRKCPKFIIARVQGKCVGGGVGLVAAADYSIAVEGADIKLSELAVGLGPFVIGPAVERKIGLSAFSTLAINANAWRNSEWGKRKGLFSEVHENLESMDESINKLARDLSNSNPEAMTEIKKMLWKDTQHWDVLLKERAAISGRLALSDYTKAAIEKIKSKA